MNKTSCCWSHSARGYASVDLMIAPQEEDFIRSAYRFLDRPSLFVRLAAQVGRPVDYVIKSLPTRHQLIIRRSTEAALKKGLMIVTSTLQKPVQASSFTLSSQSSRKAGRWHTAASFGVGAAGGFFGIISLPIELPLTTAIILRSVLRTAAEFGMDVRDPQVQLECLYILSLGSPKTSADDTMSSAYWASRASFARLANEASSYIVGKSAQQIAKELEGKTAPLLMKFLAQVATRFEVVVSEKFLAEAVPVIGALGGAALNAAFTDYFSQAARFHFGLRTLELKYVQEMVESIYSNVSSNSRADSKAAGVLQS